MQPREDVRALSDVEAEQVAVAAVIGLPTRQSEDLRRMLTAEDFFLPGNAALWSAAVETAADGNKGASTIAGRMVDQGLVSLFGDKGGERRETDRQIVDLSMRGSVMSDSEAIAAAHRVAEKSAARRAYVAVDHARHSLLAGHDAEDVAQETIGNLRDIRSAETIPAGLYRTADFWRMGRTKADPLIPGLMNREWRVVIVGFEGSGKTWLARQITEFAAAGMHPLRFNVRIPPITTLYIDLENPSEAVNETFDRILPDLEQEPGYDPDRAHLLHRPEGLDIRSSPGYADLATTLRLVRPDLVAIGPAYHMSKKLPREDDEQFATSTLNVLSELRIRFGFGLLLEHHAPHGDSAKREMRPFGSSAWLRWPEIGIGLRPSGGPNKNDPSVMKLERWRGDRVQNEWPETINRRSDGNRPWVIGDRFH